MEEYNITISVSKDAFVRYEHAAESLRLALEAFDEAARLLKEGVLDYGNDIEEAVEAVRKAKFAKAEAAAALAEEASFLHRHPMPGGKTRAERAREGAEAVKYQINKFGLGKLEA